MLARLPLQNLLKNELHLDRSSNSAFFFWAGLAWYLKPFAGIVTDAFPLFGNRRKSYILLSATFAALAWLVLSVTPHAYRDMLLVAIVINVFMVVTIYGGGRLHGGNRAGRFGLRPADRHPAVRSAGVPDR